MIEYEMMNGEAIDGMVEIEEQCFNSGFARQTFEKELENKLSLYVVAKEDEKVLGYAGVWNICGEADIMNVGVHKEFRRCKIATNMLKVLIEKCREAGVRAFNLEVRKSNMKARRLYLSLGFVEVGLREKYYNGIEDAVLMRLEFTEDAHENTCD